MSLFITQCPHCNTAFRTSISQLQSADGMVRCGACLRVFAADDNLLPSVDLHTIETPVQEEMVEEDDFDVAEEQLAIDEFETEVAQSTQDDAVVSIFTLDMADSLPNRQSPHISSSEPFWQLIEEEQDLAPEEQASVAAPLPATESSPVSQDSLEEDARIRARITAIDFDDEILTDSSGQNSYTRFSAAEVEGISNAEAPLELSWMAEPTRNRHGLALSALVVLLSLGLATQTLWFNKNNLSQYPRLRGALDAACARLSCSLAPLVDLRAIRSDTLVVRSHSDIANALSVNFQFRNDAKFAQPFPGLSLRFTDADDQLIAQRRFAPSEYLPEGVADLGTMPPGSPVQVRLDILDPGIKAINYEISFYANHRP